MMRKIYLITYALLMISASVYAQNVKNTNQDNDNLTKMTKSAVSENQPSTTATQKNETSTVAMSKVEGPGATSQQTIVPKSETLTTAAPKTTAPETSITSTSGMPKSIAPEGTLQKIMSPELTEHKMVNIGLDTDTRQHIASILHKLLANEYALYAKTQKYHWNVRGKFFGQLHTLFQKQYELLAEIIDQTAERSLSLGISSIGGLKELTSLATIPEETNENKDDVAMIKQLLTDHEIIIKYLRTGIDTSAKLNDMGTNNFLSDLITKHEKMAWMLRAHLQ